jgi:hypothetical protein
MSHMTRRYVAIGAVLVAAFLAFQPDTRSEQTCREANRDRLRDLPQYSFAPDLPDCQGFLPWP